jgi:hypothetical protein
MPQIKIQNECCGLDNSWIIQNQNVKDYEAHLNDIASTESREFDNKGNPFFYMAIK